MYIMASFYMVSEIKEPKVTTYKNKHNKVYTKN